MLEVEVRFKLPTSNNQVEYEGCFIGLRMEFEMGP